MPNKKLFLAMIVLAAPIFADKGFCRGLTDAEKIAVVYDMYAEYKKSFPRVADIPTARRSAPPQRSSPSQGQNGHRLLHHQLQKRHAGKKSGRKKNRIDQPERRDPGLGPGGRDGGRSAGQSGAKNPRLRKKMELPPGRLPSGHVQPVRAMTGQR